MEDKLLKEMVSDYNSMLKIASRDYSEIEELEKDPKVQRYLNLLKLKNAFMWKDSVIGEIVYKYSEGLIEETNGIMVYIFEFPAYHLRKLSFNIDKSIDDNQVLVVYRDLENIKKIVIIKKEEQEEFESTHKVTYGKESIRDEYDRYFNIRTTFFKDCISLGQEEAIKRVLTRNN